MTVGLNEATRILESIGHGDCDTAGQLLPLVYDELRQLAGEQRQHTLQPTALVHETWLKISGNEKRAWTYARAWLHEELTKGT